MEQEFPPPPEFGGSPSRPGREDGAATT